MAELSIQQMFDLALQHHRRGQLQEARELCLGIVAREPEHADALHTLGVIALQGGQSQAAVEWIGRAISIYVDRANDSPQVESLRRDLAESHGNLGIALGRVGRLDDAITALRQALVFRPDSAEVYNNLGHVLQTKGDLAGAIDAFRRAVSLRSDYAEAYSNLGNALRAAGRIDEALTALRRAPDLGAHRPEAYNHLGVTLAAANRREEAIAAFAQAIALRPEYCEAHNNLAHTLQDLGRLDEAIACFDRALGIQPSHPTIHSNRLLALHFHPRYDAAALLREAQEWNRRHAEPLKKEIRPHGNDREADRRLRIGYVSPDFRNHCQSFFTIPLLRQHNHRDFEIFCYSNVAHPDDFTRRIEGHADVWRNIRGMSDEQAAELVRSDRIDILVDLAMHLCDGRLLLFARKPAPVQVAWLAYPGTTGLSSIDYRLTDPFLDPPGTGDADYCEQSFRLPDTFWCYDPLSGEPAVNALPALSAGHFTFGCLNNFCKVNGLATSLWCKVLAKVPDSRLIVLCPPGEHRDKLRQALGVEAQRIEFVAHQPRRQYLQTYHRIDLGLDTFPYNGHTTSLDSLWMGVPVVTLPGRTVVSRAGYSQASNLGLAEQLVAQSPEQFVEIAAHLAADLPRLSQLRAGLRERMQRSPLMDAGRFARNMESAYRQMWRRWCQTP
ncbi:MAG: tetratricopeptide repeat protein [Tepidisphaeraceae bacterium]